jgi:hypothetical protein
MTTGSILFGVALLFGVLLFVAWPYFTDPRPQPSTLPSPRQQLLLHKDVLLEQLRQMDFDQETGKIDPEVYALARPRLIEEAALILKQLDDLADPHTDSAIESAIAQIRTSQTAPLPTGAQGNGTGLPTDDAIEAAIARKRSSSPSVALATPSGGRALATQVGTATGEDRFCSQCGKPLAPEDQFCAYCGRKRK